MNGGQYQYRQWWSEVRISGAAALGVPVSSGTVRSTCYGVGLPFCLLRTIGYGRSKKKKTSAQYEKKILM